MRKPNLSAYCLLVCAFAITAEARADSRVCLTLAQSLKPDVLIQGSSFEQYSQLQNLVRNDLFSSWGNASNSSLSGGISIPEEVDAFLNTKSNSSNWGQNRSQFLAMSYQVASASGSNNTRISQISTAALRIVSDCARDTADLNGFSATLRSVSPNRDSFEILLMNRTGGDPHWSLTQFSAQPSDHSFKCTDDYQNASIARPIALKTQTQSIVCSKDPAKHLILAIQTSAGAAQTAFSLESIHEEIQKLREDTNAAIQSLTSRLDKPGIVMAFAASTCPAPWAVYQPAAGRFIRGLDPSGTIDPDGANRAVESLQPDGIISHSHTMGVNGADSSTMVHGGAAQRLSHFKGDDDFGAGPPKSTNSNVGGLTETRPKNVALLYCILK